MLNYQGLDLILSDILQEITQYLKTIIHVDRTTIFLVDPENHELWSFLGSDLNHILEVRIPAHTGIAREVASFKKSVNLCFDFYDIRHSRFDKRKELEIGYRTYNLLSLPLLDSLDNLIGIIKFFNKLKSDDNLEDPLRERVDLTGFTQEDEEKLAQAATTIRPNLKRCQSLYAEIKKQRAIVALLKATHTISQGGLDQDTILKLIVDEAKELMNADRSLLWLVNHESPPPLGQVNSEENPMRSLTQNTEVHPPDPPSTTPLTLSPKPRNTPQEGRHLWTKIFMGDGSWREIHLPFGMGFAGRVAESGESLNIPFDLYEHPHSEKIQTLDQRTNYRSCSLLCMPIFNVANDLIGVIELINKKKAGIFPEYNPDDWPLAPEVFNASFSEAAEKLMSAFNVQIAVALQNAQLVTQLKQQDKMQQTLLKSISNSVIHTDQSGRIIALNQSAKQLLKIPENAPVEGLWLGDLIQLKEENFGNWLQAALDAKDKKARQQHHREQTLISKGEEHIINLSINAIPSDGNKNYGLLVVLDDITHEKPNSKISSSTDQALSYSLFSDGDLGSLTQKEVSVLFSDLRRYTSLIEGKETAEVVSWINKYFEWMVDAVFQYKGTLDKYINDAITAVFGSPLTLADHAWYAIQTAIEIRKRLATFNSHQIAQNQQPITLGIGINSDKVFRVNLGSSKPIEFTAFGEGVNLASRLESASREYGCDIVISETTYRHCADRIWVRELDRIYGRDTNQPLAIYELVGLNSEPISPQKQQLIEHYHQGRQLYCDRKFALAMQEFALVLAIDGSDKASILHMQRCLQWLQSPPPEDWDGVWTIR